MKYILFFLLILQSIFLQAQTGKPAFFDIPFGSNYDTVKMIMNKRGYDCQYCDTAIPVMIYYAPYEGFNAELQLVFGRNGFAQGEAEYYFPVSDSVDYTWNILESKYKNEYGIPYEHKPLEDYAESYLWKVGNDKQGIDIRFWRAKCFNDGAPDGDVDIIKIFVRPTENSSKVVAIIQHVNLQI